MYLVKHMVITYFCMTIVYFYITILDVVSFLRSIYNWPRDDVTILFRFYTDKPQYTSLVLSYGYLQIMFGTQK